MRFKMTFFSYFRWGAAGAAFGAVVGSCIAFYSYMTLYRITEPTVRETVGYQDLDAYGTWTETPREREVFDPSISCSFSSDQRIQALCQVAASQLRLQDTDGALASIELLDGPSRAPAIGVLLDELRHGEKIGIWGPSQRDNVSKSTRKRELSLIKQALPTLVDDSASRSSLLVSVGNIEAVLGETSLARETLRSASKTSASISPPAKKPSQNVSPTPNPIWSGSSKVFLWVPFGAVIGYVLGSLFKPVFEGIGKKFISEPLLKLMEASKQVGPNVLLNAKSEATPPPASSPASPPGS